MTLRRCSGKLHCWRIWGRCCGWSRSGSSLLAKPRSWGYWGLSWYTMIIYIYIWQYIHICIGRGICILLLIIYIYIRTTYMIKNWLVNLLYGSLESLFNLKIWGISMKVQGLLLDCLPFSCSLQEKAVQEAVEKRSVRHLTATPHWQQGWVAEFSWLDRTKRLHHIWSKTCLNGLLIGL